MHSFLAASLGSCRLRHGNMVNVLYGKDVREVMVTLMMSPTRQQSIATRDCDVENKFDTIVSEDKVGNTWEAGDLPKACTFWCAVAIGVLAEGDPIGSVAHYFRRAKAALASSQARPTWRWPRRGRYWGTSTPSREMWRNFASIWHSRTALYVTPQREGHAIRSLWVFARSSSTEKRPSSSLGEQTPKRSSRTSLEKFHFQQ
ncbi:unnamed protein product [Ectocarpus sp. 12 AP-2014]